MRRLAALALLSMSGCGEGVTTPTPSPTPAAPARFAYVANAVEPLIFAYTVDQATGRLSFVGSTRFEGGDVPLVIAADPQGRWLWAGTRGRPVGVQAFAIDRATGLLSALPGSPFLSGTEADALNPAVAGRFLVVTGSFPFVLGTAAVGAAGALTAQGGALSLTGFPSASPAFHPGGRYLFVPSADPNALAVFSFDPANGVLRATGANAAAPDRPRWASVDPSGRFLYLTTATPFSSNTLFLYQVNAATGALTRSAGSGFDPAFDPGAANLRAGTVTVDLAGRFAYVWDTPGRTGARSLGYSVFPIQAGGRLGPARTGPFTTRGGNPGAIALDPSGRFALVLDAAGEVSSFTIDAATGALRLSSEPTATGSYPQAIVVVP
jgi:6-phosphogluconolactonase (cycloisomerase 2 family)